MKSKFSKSILVCGGAGFMGSNFIRYIHNTYHDYKIVNLDLLTYAGNLDNLKDVESSKRYEFIHGDIGDKPLVDAILVKNKFDVVINFAAESHVDRSLVDAFQFIRTNVQGAYILLESVRRHRVPRFIYISTDEVYGDISAGIKSSEDYPFTPTNPYSATKAGADLMTQAYMKTHRVPALIIRSSNNFGPYQYPEKLHGLVISNFLEGIKIPVHGNGKHLRSWLHVEDFCRVLDLIMHKADDFKIYNISGEEKSNIEVIKMIAGILNKDYSQYIEFVNDRPGPDLRYALDHSLIEKELGWERKHSYSDSLKGVIDWYAKNKPWWQKIKKDKDFLEHYEKQRKGVYDL